MKIDGFGIPTTQCLLSKINVPFPKIPYKEEKKKALLYLINCLGIFLNPGNDGISSLNLNNNNMS